MAKRRRVVVTGMGAVSPLGTTMEATWNGMVEGKRVAGPVRRFDASEYPCKIAYEVEDFIFDTSVTLERERRYINAAAEFAITAGNEAWKQAGMPDGQDERKGVCIGVGMGCPDLQFYQDVFIEDDFRHASLDNHIRHFPNQVTSILGRMIGAQGGLTTVHTACASSGQSLGAAFEQIAYGDLDVVLTGGTDSMVHPYYLAGFSLLGALSQRNDDPLTASRPFDKHRNGFVLGEGACMLVFEEYERAVSRGATILGEVCGYGVSNSAYRITDLHPEGRGPVEAMQLAVDDAGIRADAVSYVNAHGTSTSLNDRIEALAVSIVFPKTTHLSSTKSMTGHMISAAGAIEFAVCLKALAHQVLPPSVNLFQKDSEITATMTPPEATAHTMQYALSNSVGFGGSNTALVAGRAPQ